MTQAEWDVILKLVRDVQELASERVVDPYWSGYMLACEEIEERLIALMVQSPV